MDHVVGAGGHTENRFKRRELGARLRRKASQTHSDPCGAEKVVGRKLRRFAEIRREIVVVAEGEIISPKTSLSLRAVVRSESRQTTVLWPVAPNGWSGELLGASGVTPRHVVAP